MARLPDMDLDPASAQPVPIDTVRPTDFGLEGASNALERASRISFRASLLDVRAQAAEDKRAIAPAAATLQAGNDVSFAQDAAGYTGDPNFAAEQMTKANARGAIAAQQLAQSGASQGQLAQFRLASQNESVRMAQTAGAHMAQYLAAPIAEQSALHRLQAQSAAVIGANAEFGPAFDQAKNNFVQGGPDLGQTAGALWDQASAKALAAVDPHEQPFVAAELQQEKLHHVLDAQAYQVSFGDAAILHGAAGQADALGNLLVSAPGQYDNVVTSLWPKVRASLPAGLQGAADQDYLPEFAKARLQGLIAAGQGAAAASELNAGKYDQVPGFTPQMKDELVARAQAGARGDDPAAGFAKARLDDRIKADYQSLSTTGKGVLSDQELNADVASGVLTGAQQGEIKYQQTKAAAIYAARGGVAAMSNADLAAAVAGGPPGGDGDDPGSFAAARARFEAEGKELAARREPGKWAWSATGQTIGGVPMAQALQAKWQAVLAGQPGAAADYAGTMLGVQHQAGIPAPQLEILPREVASGLAAGLASAAPDQRFAQLKSLAALAAALPTKVTAPDGTEVNARALLLRQLTGKGGLSGVEASAIADFAQNPAALGRVAAALNDSRLKGPMDRATASQLPGLVRTNLQPYLASDPGGAAIAQARIDRTTLVARQLMAEGANAPDAAERAAADLVGGYSFKDGFRLPLAVANAPVMAPGRLFGLPFGASATGEAAVRTGLAQVTAGLTANGGAGLYAPSTIAGDPPHRQQVFASQLAKSAQWKTLPDDSGVTLAVPKPDGTWQAAADKYGRPVQMTWGQAIGVAQGQPSPFAAAPAGALRTPAGTPVRAFPASEGGQALSTAVEWQESRGRIGAVSPKGALGVMQVTPATGARYAPQLGLAWDPQRALSDPDYNRKIGNAALFDLARRYMTGANPSAGLVLALAGYNAGEGWLNGFHDARGYHPGWLQTIGDPRTGQLTAQQFVDRIPIGETRAYVGQVLAHAVGLIHGGG